MSENQKPNILIIAALMRGRIAQILTDAETHPDPKARLRLTKSANRIADIVKRGADARADSGDLRD